MNVGRLLLVWAARHILALILIVLMLVAAPILLPPLTGWIKQEVREARTVPRQRAALAEALDRYRAYAAGRLPEAEQAAETLRAAPAAALRQRRAAIGPAIARHDAATLSGTQLAMAAVQGNADTIFDHYRARAETELLRRELQVIDGLLAQRAADRRRIDLGESRRSAVQQMVASRARWQAARSRADLLNRRPLAPARNLICRNSPLGVGCENYRALAAANQGMRSAVADYRSARRQIQAIDLAARQLSAGRAAAEGVASVLGRQSAGLRADLTRVEAAARDNWLVWTKARVLEVLPVALAILALAIFAPVLLKAFFYFLVAPLAAARPPLRLVAGETGDILATDAAPSRAVSLEPGHELLIVPDAVQSTPESADKRTQWLLSWSMPLSSIASGMVGLVRLRAQVPETVTASATSGLAGEIALITIGDGAALVLRPRALRGILQRIDRPIRITRHWRLRRLSAWLTFQFRYLVFHGPCTLIVEGARGVRLEPAGSGRAINQAATLGFSAGLAYSVTRSEAFGAYLMGKQELFNDAFAGGPGYFLYEEVPRDGAGGGPWGRGLRGIGDAALKMFGL